jgi:hypothetical protein
MKEAAGRDECYLYVDAVRTLFGLNGSGAADGREPADEAPDAAAAATDGAREAISPASREPDADDT